MDVEGKGNGKSFTRVDPIKEELPLQEFIEKFSKQFKEYSRHIVVSWFLTNTKNQIQKLSSARENILFVTSDFAENVTVIRKYELADQYFHRIEILLFGAVVSYITPGNEEQDPQLHQRSYMVSSDYRYETCVCLYPM